jgi:catechol 2,3-dioxygenase-like lactoylglutathione lyase family enzyme
MNVKLMASCAVITPDPPMSRRLFVDALALPLETADGDDYAHSERIDGVRHFGVWPLAQAAQACFGTPDWPSDRPVPQACFEFDFASPAAVQEAADELATAGHTLIHPAREEPWGQTVARLQSFEGPIIGVSYTPWMHDDG